MPYKIKWKSFTSGPPLLEALNAGAIDIGGVGNTPPLFAAAGKSKIEVVSGATMGAKGDTIVVPEGLPHQERRRPQGQEGRRRRGQLGQLQPAGPARARPGSSYDDIEVEALQPADALAAFTNKHVDAWAIWDPYTSQAELEADARILVDGGGLVNGMTFQAANPDALDDKATRAALKDYLGRIAKAQVWSNTHRDEWAKVWAEETGPVRRGHPSRGRPSYGEADADQHATSPPPSRRWPTRSSRPGCSPRSSTSRSSSPTTTTSSVPAA